MSAGEIAVRLAAVRARIDLACERSGRDKGSVKLLAVSKRHPAEAIREAYAAGQREFGENYVQELVQKADALSDLANLRLRLIGNAQRNKAKDIVRVRCAVDSVDSLKLAEALDSRAREAGIVLDVHIQVNIGDEPQKGGVSVADLPQLTAAVRGMGALRLEGLLAIPPATEDAEQSRPYFRRMRELAATLGLQQLSMGMSDDMDVAIEEGATVVRVGTAIFGART